MNASIKSITKFDYPEFATAQKNSRDWESSQPDHSREFNQPANPHILSWLNRELDRPCPVYSPLNEW